MSNVLNEASLVLIPSGYKSGKVYSQIPENGDGDLSFTRSNDTATRVNSAGLIEKVRTNLVLYSEEFNNASWLKTGATLTAGQSDPNGGTNAFKLELASGANNFLYQSVSSIPVGQKTISCWMRADSAITIAFGMGGSTATSVNLTTSWVRYSIITTDTSGGMFFANYFPVIGQPALTFYIFQSQYETGDIATDYIPTTTTAVSVGMTANVPRLDYSGGGCPKLLLEPQRTNLFIQSENLFTTNLVQNLTTSGNVNVETSPDGTQNADKFVPNSTNGVHGIANGSSLAITSGQTYSFSAFVKSDGGEYNLIALVFDSSTAWGTTKNCIFNASTGASYSVPSGATMSSKNMGNGWYRITATLTASGSVSASLYQYRIYIANSSGNLGFAASIGNTDGIYVYGAQLEQGAYPTSYIPTLGAAVTRGADACSKTGISSLIGQTEGTLFVEFTPTSDLNTDVIQLVATTATDNVVTIGCGLGRIYGSVYTDPIYRFNVEIFKTIPNNTFKVAICYKTNDFTFFINGVKVASGANSYSPSSPLTKIAINQALFFGKQAVNYKNSLVFPVKLSDTQAIELTTL